ncbi:hypothetical protein [Burkholderia gladioli]|uniref:hypothetical protein n=1 Tax=Burkholderia gladioli TaxID=28095 RepID=UPI00031CCB0E|nr:hypothetical protein [Burkholderia gladioli]MBW5288105.1 hypothetical protein [Burkholderia gladioli]
MSQLEDRFDYLFGRISALEVAVAGILATASDEQRAKVAAFLELANAGDLR